MWRQWIHLVFSMHVSCLPCASWNINVLNILEKFFISAWDSQCCWTYSTTCLYVVRRFRLIQHGIVTATIHVHESVSDVMDEFCIFNRFMWKSNCNINRCRKNWNCLFSNVFGMLIFAAVENSIRISFLNSFFFSSKKGLNKDRNSIGRLSLLCLVSRSLCELHECKKVTLSWAERFL